MALHIAVACGLDPTSQDRATDLLVLQRQWLLMSAR
jgi:hypothetical protein